MIRFTNGDIFASSAEALVNPVNCVGVMGKGLAAEFKRRYPENFDRYREACRADRLAPGLILATPGVGVGSPRWIVNLATKDHWKHPSRIEWVAGGLGRLRGWIIASNVRSIAIPALGCGLGGLPWADVKGVIGRALGGGEMEDVEIEVHEPPRPAAERVGGEGEATP